MTNYCIDTPCGRICGTACQWPGVVAYKGIRYATAGRWEYPARVTHWDGTWDATSYGPCCYQPRAFYDESQTAEKSFYYNEFRRGERYAYSEDCLFLNIWTPENATPQSRLPVLVYIHGGGYTGGCGHEKHFDGPVWPLYGVVAVTLNYRLGPLGFACLPELAQEAGHTGNYGLYDQQAALQWVQENIAAFGGDPAKVTIMGQSAGAMSVQLHCLSPLTDGLFRAAVMSSGGGVSDALIKSVPAEERYDYWQNVAAEAGCAHTAELRALEPAALFAAWSKVNKASGGGLVASPCIDGAFLPAPPAELAGAGRQKNIPYLIGTTSEDIFPPIVHKMATDWCLLQAEQGKQPSYAWLFDRQLPGDDRGAWHSSDLWYWFGTLDHCWRPMKQKDRELSRQMVSYLVNFVKNGDPNGDGLPEWLPITAGQKKLLRIGEKPTHMGGASMAKLTRTMLTKPAVGE